MNLDADLRHALDPCALFETAIGAPPDEWQARVLRSTAQRTILNVCRQAGKSTTAAVVAYGEAVYHPPALVLLVSPSLRQSGELFRKVLDVHRAVGAGVPVEAETTLKLELRNGSRIIALPGSSDTTRGFSNVRLLIEDESSRVEDALHFALRPVLAVSRGRLLLMSTPNGKRGHFFDTWAAGGLGWERVRVPASACPRITPEFLAEERASIGEYFYSQEYDTQFRDADDQFFNGDDIARMLDPSVKPLWPSLIAPLGVPSDAFFDADLAVVKEIT
jgi:hypothetical protein